MKKIIIVKVLCLFLLTSSAYSQESNDKVILMDSLKRIVTTTNYDLKKVVKNVNVPSDKYKYYIYNKANTIIEEGNYTDTESNKYVGKIIHYYKNGNRQNEVNFVNGRPFGLSSTYYENGNINEEVEYLDLEELSYKKINYWDESGKQLIVNGNGFYIMDGNQIEEKGQYKNGYKDGKWIFLDKKSGTLNEDLYDNGKFISGFSLVKDGSKKEYFELFVKPAPMGGMEAFYQYISKNFRIGRIAAKNNIKGKIFLTFVVDKNGNLVEPKIIKSLGYGLDEEAIRIIKKSEKWIPGMQRGINVRVQYSLPITISY